MRHISLLNVQYININPDKYLPLLGVYFFTFSMMKHEDVEEVYVYLMHNGNTVFSMYRWVVFPVPGNTHATTIVCSNIGVNTA